VDVDAGLIWRSSRGFLQMLHEVSGGITKLFGETLTEIFHIRKPDHVYHFEDFVLARL
jgi:hypothetical protein